MIIQLFPNVGHRFLEMKKRRKEDMEEIGEKVAADPGKVLDMIEQYYHSHHAMVQETFTRAIGMFF